VFARCPAAGKAQLEHAILTARHAGVAWGRKSFDERAAAIKKMATVLRANQDSLAELLTREQGKPVAQSRDEIGRAAAQSEGMAAIPVAVEKLVEDAERRIELHYRPLGVVGIITPWNAPINLAAGPLVAALYSGNTVVLKPSPYTPLSTLKLGELLRDVFPPGVINILAGGDELGHWMTEAPGSHDPELAAAIAARPEVGTAWVNQHRATAATVPFGGAKESGIGRQYSILGLKENMEAQVISVLKQPM
jgi:acyl-CoA reductase-like NAD-dependent aldehyde dehydrogenase